MLSRTVVRECDHGYIVRLNSGYEIVCYRDEVLVYD